MKTIPLRIFLIAISMLIYLPSVTPLFLTEEFQARLLGQTSHPGFQATKFIISIDSYTTAEEVYELIKIFSREGYEAFMSAFRASIKGFVRPIGGRGVRINIYAAHSIPTEKGRKVVLFTQRQSLDIEAHQKTDPRFTFMVFELNLDQKGNGGGKIYEQARIRLTDYGMIEMESYNSAPLQLWSVSPRK